MSKLNSNEGQELDYTLKTCFNEKTLAIFVRNVGKKEYTLYLYDHSTHWKYTGFLNLLDFIDFEPHD